MIRKCQPLCVIMSYICRVHLLSYLFNQKNVYTFHTLSLSFSLSFHLTSNRRQDRLGSFGNWRWWGLSGRKWELSSLNNEFSGPRSVSAGSPQIVQSRQSLKLLGQINWIIELTSGYLPTLCWWRRTWRKGRGRERVCRGGGGLWPWPGRSTRTRGRGRTSGGRCCWEAHRWPSIQEKLLRILIARQFCSR